MARAAPTESFQAYQALVESDHAGAAAVVFERFADRLVNLARKRLSAQMRRKVDPEDVTQSVFKSFFRPGRRNDFTLHGWGDLWGVLVTITLRKCGRQISRFHTGRRDIRRETSGDRSSSRSLSVRHIASSQPTPADAVMLIDTVRQLMRSMDEECRQVFALRLQGLLVSEISAQLGRSPRTVHRAVAIIKRRVRLASGDARDATLVRALSQSTAARGTDSNGAPSAVPPFLAPPAKDQARRLELLQDPSLQQIAQWKWDGVENEEIARRLGCVTRSVQRKLALIQRRWSREL